ncbi:glycoside hydrolase family 3 N-terminal domain-containing protein [Niabella yanshanensis]|uniref:Glycoside hydrolase family 3 N-terminal domain-containing protein n=1 Tax=Niabella yanshanensis TaxID=577386 RepID=A0ABZ0W497_9BACT|nr:glycoside hydrolase family 3 N-terminal domain-containing protein [Niabella yanshanensis]WQD37534.1 glycoside hydrolase family 3 N-terminal domain-containing protein [Niabella yanshanensis]
MSITSYRLTCSCLLLFACIVSVHGQQYIYKDNTQPVEKRVADLLARMTPEEKFWQLFMIPGDLDDAGPNQYKNGLFGFQVSAKAKGDAAGQLLSYNTQEDATKVIRKINSIQKYFVEQTRLGIPMIAFDEALHGLVRSQSTAFPQAIALAATWDTAMVHRVASDIASQVKERGIRQILSPVVNIASDVRWGRTEETYGEDPYLTSAMGVAFMSAFEQKGIITTPKHFVANVGDGGRDSYPIHFNERFLREIHFPPFIDAIKKAGARSIMTAYNSLDGTAASSNHWLLIDKLKKKWGFKGFVISDANAVGGEAVLHYTAKDYEESGAHAINGGLDVIFQTDYEHHKLFMPAFLNGKIDQSRIDDAVSRVLRAKFELGLFENPYIPETSNNLQLLRQGKATALEAARKSFVLLKNEQRVLPLSKNIQSLAIIGTDAIEARLGGYAGEGFKKINMLDAIKEKLGNKTQVYYAEGVDRQDSSYRVISGQYLSNNGKPGLKAEYFSGRDMSGKPSVVRTDAAIDFLWTLYAPDAKLNRDFYAARWTGTLTAPRTGNYKIGIEGNDGYRLYINDQLLVDQWQKLSYHTTLKNYSFEAGKKYTIKVEFYETNGNGGIRLAWDEGKPDNTSQKIKDAVAAAQKADVAVIVAGITEGEFLDRAMLSLPGKQEALIQAIAAIGKPVVVLLVGGSAITMQPWADQVKAIGHTWYGGEEGGRAVADVLFGDYNPAGRLPITFPVHEAQLPLVYNHKPTGRGDDYNNLSGQPLFPFGFGLSYTQFEYSNLVLDKKQIKPSDSIRIQLTVKNTGTRDGDEVVQLYLRDELASVARPVMELKGFQRIHLKGGQSRQLSFVVCPEHLSMLDKDLRPVIEPGSFRIMIGASSKDIRLREAFEVK